MSQQMSHDTKPPIVGLPMLAVVGLALLAVPRAVLHDLHLLEEGGFVNALFVFVPLVVWIVVAVWWRVPKPFVTLAAVGTVYGLFLAICHQALWHINIGASPPTLGGNLTGLDPSVQGVIMRLFACISSLFTGVITGAICGLVAWGVGSIRSRFGRTSD